MTRLMHRFAYPLSIALMGLLVFAGLAFYMRNLEHRAIHNPLIQDQLLASGRARPVAQVARTIARMALVTAEVQTTVKAEVANENWRGLATATVEAPARLLFGVDVSRFDVDSIGYSPASSSYLVRIPPPRRIATEVCGGDEAIDVRVGWARLRSVAGEYYLGQARKALYARAREMTLSSTDAIKVRQLTQAQVEESIRRIVGPDASITVIFDDSAQPTTTAEGESP